MESKTKQKKRVEQIAELLEREYPDAVCSLEYLTPYQLLVATRLSAQCTDARVNIITPALFQRYPDVYAMAAAEVSDVESLIKSCGLYKTKARDIVGMSKMLIDNFGGDIPDTIEQLTTLPGVGRKTANLIVGDVYGKPAIVTDTHFIRLSNRLGFVNTKDAFKVEKAMRELIQPEISSDFCHRAVLHGRAVCTARSPKCEECGIAEFCPSKQKG